MNMGIKLITRRVNLMKVEENYKWLSLCYNKVAHHLLQRNLAQKFFVVSPKYYKMAAFYYIQSNYNKVFSVELTF